MRPAAIALAFLVAAPADAQQAGDTILSVGWVHVHAVRSRADLHTNLRPNLAGRLLGIPESFDSPGTSISVSKVDTLGINATRYLTDRWSIDFAGGIPAKVDVYGQGVASPGGAFGAIFSVDLGDPAVNPLGSARQWSPALLAIRHFAFGPHFQPFVGVGVSYTWFTQVRLNPAFEEELDARIGQPLALAAGKPGPTSIMVDAPSTWAPVFNVGLPWILSEHWMLIGSLGFAPFRPRARIEIFASDGTLLSSTRVRAGIDAAVSGVLLGYRF